MRDGFTIDEVGDDGVFTLTLSCLIDGLQLLAHPDPTRDSLLSSNGWSAEVHQAAEDVLLARGLAEERTHAGRRAYLPGPRIWSRLPAFPRGLEAWKLPVLGLSRTATGYRGPLGPRILPPEPFGALFRRAWARIEAGDRPDGARSAPH